MLLPITLRPFRIDDAEALHAAVRESFDALYPWMPWCHADYAIEETRGWLEMREPAFQSGSSYEFAMLSPDGTLLGVTGLNQVDGLNKRANLGYWVRTSAACRGVATAAVHAIRDWGFANTDLIRLEIVIARGNAASVRVAEKAGAVHEGTLRSRLIIHGEVHDAALFSFVRPQ